MARPKFALRVRSDEGKGSTFTVTLRRVLPQEDENHAASDAHSARERDA